MGALVYAGATPDGARTLCTYIVCQTRSAPFDFWESQPRTMWGSPHPIGYLELQPRAMWGSTGHAKWPRGTWVLGSVEGARPLGLPPGPSPSSESESSGDTSAHPHQTGPLIRSVHRSDSHSWTGQDLGLRAARPSDACGPRFCSETMGPSMAAQLLLAFSRCSCCSSAVIRH